MNAEAALSGIKVVQGEGRHAVAVCAGLLARLGAEVVRGAGMAGAHIYVGARPTTLPPATAVRCFISATGALRHPSIAVDDPEIVMQALGGLMGTSGEADGPPQPVMVPVLEAFAGIDAAASIIAALRVVEAGGPEQDIDASVWDTNASLLGTFVAQATAGKGSGYREGARHSICAPWNAFAASDGFVMICTSSDAQWKKLLGLMGQADKASDPAFIDMTARRANIAAVDALVESWTRTQRVSDLATLLKKNGIAAGAIATGAGEGVAPLPFVLTPLTRAGKSSRPVKTGGSAPLKGIRVVEIGPFTAGPVTGRSLSDLGADVVKVEPPGGEVSRAWSPRAGHVSGYFAHYNTGKRSVMLDLAKDDDRAVLDTLLGHADVLVQNLKAGALDKLGFGVDAVTRRHPHLIYCSISGYGHHGAQDAALDTVIQAESGIMTRVGSGATPCKVGFSIADLLSGHVAVLGILAALRLRDRTGYAHHVDVSMLAALKWLMAQGAQYPAAHFAGDVARDEQGRWMLRRDGAGDIVIRDLGDVLADETLAARGMLRRMPSSGGAVANVLGSPYPLTLTPPVPGAMIGEAGADCDSVLREWTMHTAAHGELA
ncbi:CoA transferase [Microbacteriaceae bacterium K1510]|nr:CoA transferase [Microbacteriaceae bacterium K1510]